MRYGRKYSGCDMNCNISLPGFIIAMVGMIIFGAWITGGIQIGNYSYVASSAVKSAISMVIEAIPIMMVIIIGLIAFALWVEEVQYGVEKKYANAFIYFGLGIMWFSAMFVLTYIFLIALIPLGLLICLTGWVSFDYCKLCKKSNEKEELIKKDNKFYCKKCNDYLIETFGGENNEQSIIHTDEK